MNTPALFEAVEAAGGTFSVGGGEVYLDGTALLPQNLLAEVMECRQSLAAYVKERTARRSRAMAERVVRHMAEKFGARIVDVLPSAADCTRVFGLTPEETEDERKRRMLTIQDPYGNLTVGEHLLTVFDVVDHGLKDTSDGSRQQVELRYFAQEKRTNGRAKTLSEFFYLDDNKWQKRVNQLLSRELKIGDTFDEGELIGQSVLATIEHNEGTNKRKEKRLYDNISRAEAVPDDQRQPIPESLAATRAKRLAKLEEEQESAARREQFGSSAPAAKPGESVAAPTNGHGRAAVAPESAAPQVELPDYGDAPPLTDEDMPAGVSDEDIPDVF